MKLLQEKIKNLPTNPGVYLMKDKYNNVIYVGKAKNLKKRVSQYFLRKQEIPKVQAMVNNVVDFDFFVVATEYDALALESNLIKKYQPYYNILLKDGKAFAYIKVNLREDFPKFEVTRKINSKDKFFGPYFAGISANDILDIINYAYPVRKCGQILSVNGNVKKSCLYHDMHLCSAPCAKKIGKEEYHEIVNSAIKFLRGDTKEIKEILNNKMDISARAENFETALILRDKIKMVDRLKERVVMQLRNNIDLDVFSMCTNGELSAMCVVVIRGGKVQGVQSFDILNFIEKDEAYQQFLVQYYTNHVYNVDEIILPSGVGDLDVVKQYIENKHNKKATITQPTTNTDKMKILKMAEQNACLHLEKNVEITKKKINTSIGAVKQLQKELGLTREPKRIECFDISHTYGEYTVASMSVLINGEKAKSHYRKFKIKNVGFIDDFASMNEVLTRRMNELNGEDISFSSMPDLIIIDGGKGQLGVAVDVVQQYGYTNDIISLAERLEEVFVPHQSKSIFLPRGSYSLRLLQLARDEAHRFAITYNRQLRSKGMYKGGLQAIKGVGPTTRKILLSKFRTLERIKNATLDELKNTKGISKQVAENIYNSYHKDI
ncbi:MAG: excinuclease ABC subunit UvrC [Clostridia bacterium]